MTKYKIISSVTIADSLNVKFISSAEILGSIANRMIDNTPRLRGVEITFNATTGESNDNDVINLSGIAVDSLNSYSDVIVRAIRKLVIDALNELCVSQLESLVYKITSLEVIKI